MAGIVWAIPEETRQRAIALHDPSANPTLLPSFVDEAHRAWAEALFGDVRDWHIHVHRIDAGMTIEHGWVKDFPHVHHDDSTTVVTFLTEPEAGGEFAMIVGGETVVVTPRIGLCVSCDGRTPHGPLPVVGPIPRYALLTTGFPWGS